MERTVGKVANCINMMQKVEITRSRFYTSQNDAIQIQIFLPDERKSLPLSCFDEVFPEHIIVRTRGFHFIIFEKCCQIKKQKKKKDVQVSVALTELLVTSYKTQIK